MTIPFDKKNKFPDKSYFEKSEQFQKIIEEFMCPFMCYKVLCVMNFVLCVMEYFLCVIIVNPLIFSEK